QRETALLGDAARGRPGRRLLDCTFLRPGDLFPRLCSFQQDLWNAGRRDRFDGLALLDQLLHAGGRGTQLRTGQGKPGRPDPPRPGSQRAHEAGPGFIAKRTTKDTKGHEGGFVRSLTLCEPSCSLWLMTILLT